MRAFISSRQRHRGFWFRIFGYGINCINREIYPPLFSTRSSSRKEMRIGSYGFHLLRASDMRATK